MIIVKVLQEVKNYRIPVAGKRGDIELFIVLVPKVLKQCFLIRYGLQL